MFYLILIFVYLKFSGIEGTLQIFYFLHKLKRYFLKKNTKTITITGSYGKTSTCYILDHILKQKYNVKHVKYNSYFGIRTSLMGINIDEFLNIKTKIRWIYLFLNLIKNTFIYFPNYDFNLIEVGIDKKEMKKKIDILPNYNLSVLTSVDYVHSENFNSITEIFDEKIKLINNLNLNGLGIINYDDENIKNNIKKINKNILIVTKDKNIIKKYNGILILYVVSNLDFFEMSFIYNNYNYKLNIKNLENNQLIPENYCYNFSISLLCASIHQIKIKDSIILLKNFKLPKSRSTIHKIFNSSLLIDSSYNSSFYPIKTLLYEINKIDMNKILILGDMKELGKEEIKLHQNIGNLILNMNKVKSIILIGKIISKHTYKVIKNKNFKIYKFNNIDEFNLDLKKLIEKNNLIFVKGSNSLNLKKICKKIVKNKI